MRVKRRRNGSGPSVLIVGGGFAGLELAQSGHSATAV
jgi:NADPH-dependent 2,4-dienoyl-CoA reductase/sulfur reductase-like enzyme